MSTVEWTDAPATFPRHAPRNKKPHFRLKNLGGLCARDARARDRATDIEKGQVRHAAPRLGRENDFSADGERAMPAFCQRWAPAVYWEGEVAADGGVRGAWCGSCGELADGDACAKCGEKTVAGATAKWASVGAVPSAFTAAARVQSMGAALAAVERPRKEKATALFNFVPQVWRLSGFPVGCKRPSAASDGSLRARGPPLQQDSATQLRLTKGEEVEVVRKDPDGWWFVVKDGEKGLVPGSYVRIDKPFVAVPDAAILAAREASNQRFLELSRPSDANGDGDAAHDVEYASPLGLEGHGDAPPAPVLPRARNSPVRADVRAGDGHGEKPQNVRKLRKCFACKETILGRTKTAKDQIFHEIVRTPP